jgi:hypothetical protein
VPELGLEPRFSAGELTHGLSRLRLQWLTGHGSASLGEHPHVGIPDLGSNGVANLLSHPEHLRVLLLGEEAQLQGWGIVKWPKSRKGNWRLRGMKATGRLTR